MVSNRLNIDQVNIALMLISCALAYVLPFELVLLSYAFLGPAHYLTQISWLHDRAYFTGAKWMWMPLGLIVLFLLFLPISLPSYLLYALALSLCCGMVLAREWPGRVACGVAAMMVFVLLRGLYPPVEMALLILLPTVIHIYVFTGLFILIGGIKSRSKWAFISFAVLMLCGAVFFLVKPLDIIISQRFTAENLHYFNIITDYIVHALPSAHLDERSMLGFLSFAYTYHYLNWFSKAEVIKWHQIPRQRLAVIVTLYFISIALYLINYSLGFFALLFLAVMHVILEFPLDIIAIKTVGQSIVKRKAV